MDGRVIENLPALEGICILNIPSWGAGVRVWGAGENIPVQKYERNCTSIDKYVSVLGSMMVLLKYLEFIVHFISLKCKLVLLIHIVLDKLVELK